MPKIFNEEDRNVIRDKLIKYGMETLKERGYKNVSIESIARQAGIAKGTFYNFFPSKEDFFYNIMLFIRDSNRTELNQFFEQEQNKESIADFLYKKYSSNKSIYYYFSTEEVQIIFRKIPDRVMLAGIDSVDFANALLSGEKVKQNTNQEPDSEVVVNMMSIMGTFAAGHMSAYEEKENKTLRLLADTLASYIMKGNER